MLPVYPDVGTVRPEIARLTHDERQALIRSLWDRRDALLGPPDWNRGGARELLHEEDAEEVADNWLQIMECGLQDHIVMWAAISEAVARYVAPR